jgi:hypothetical protein
MFQFVSRQDGEDLQKHVKAPEPGFYWVLERQVGADCFRHPHVCDETSLKMDDTRLRPDWSSARDMQVMVSLTAVDETPS